MGRKRRELRPDETELWNRVARTTSPLHRDRVSGLPASRPVLPPAPNSAPPPSGTDLTGFRIGGKRADTAPPFQFEPGSTGQPAVRMDAKAFDRMKRGKLEVQARIDLHGSTLAEAQPRLLEFIHSTHAQGKRLVLVITGKGRDDDTGYAVPMRRGRLRHQVPIWLTSGSLGPLVLQVTQAHRRHGGSGAFYVYLRRK